MNTTHEFIRIKIKEVEKAIRARTQLRNTYLSGTNESWTQASNMHSSTDGKTFSKKARLEEAQSQNRILIKLRIELAMFNDVLTALLSIQ